MTNPIDGRVYFDKSANETPHSAAEETEKTMHASKKELQDFKKAIETTVYTKDKSEVASQKGNKKEVYRLKPSVVDFLSLPGKVVAKKEYGNAEFDHMIKTLYIIQYNNKWAWDTYNTLCNGNYKLDSVQTIFQNLVKFMQKKWIDRPSTRTWTYTNADFLYMVAVGQSMVIQKAWTQRKDLSANAVSSQFGDYILGKGSMEDFQKLPDATARSSQETHQEANVVATTPDASISVTSSTETKQDVPVVIPETVEKVWNRNLPKKSDIYREGNSDFLITPEDVKDIKNMQFLSDIYASLGIESWLDNVEDAEILKNFVLSRMKQIDLAINEIKQGIQVNGDTFTLTDAEIRKVLKSWTWSFFKEIKVNGKLYEAKFSLRTKEMEKLQDNFYLFDKDGKILPGYTIQPTGLTYHNVKWLFNNKLVNKVQVGPSGRIIYQKG